MGGRDRVLGNSWNSAFEWKRLKRWWSRNRKELGESRQSYKLWGSWCVCWWWVGQIGKKIKCSVSIIAYWYQAYQLLKGKTRWNVTTNDAFQLSGGLVRIVFVFKQTELSTSQHISNIENWKGDRVKAEEFAGETSSSEEQISRRILTSTRRKWRTRMRETWGDKY